MFDVLKTFQIWKHQYNKDNFLDFLSFEDQLLLTVAMVTHINVGC